MLTFKEYHKLEEVIEEGIFGNIAKAAVAGTKAAATMATRRIAPKAIQMKNELVGLYRQFRGGEQEGKVESDIPDEEKIKLLATIAKNPDEYEILLEGSILQGGDNAVYRYESHNMLTVTLVDIATNQQKSIPMKEFGCTIRPTQEMLAKIKAEGDTPPANADEPDPNAPANADEPDPNAPAPAAASGRSDDPKNVFKRIRRALNAGKPPRKSDIEMLVKAGVADDRPFKYSDGSITFKDLKNMELSEDGEDAEQRLDDSCWDGYKKQGTKMKGGVRVNNCVKR